MLRPTLLLLLLGLLLIGATAAADSASGEEVKNKIPSFYDFTVPGPDGEEILLSERIDPTKKPVVLVVNVASKCGYTDTHYRQLQQMYEKYADSGLEIVAFPCNQFGEQEPEPNAKIQRFAKETYGATFPILGKVEVNGENQLELFAFLKQLSSHEISRAEPPKDNHKNRDIRWNFAKFVVVNGKPMKRYAHDINPMGSEVERYIVSALREQAAKEL